MKRLLLLGIIGAFVIPSLAGSQVPRFTDHSDETVTDNVTGLMWQQEDDDVRRDWEDALVYCEELDLAGYTDWRLPDGGELRSICCLVERDKSRLLRKCSPVLPQCRVAGKAEGGSPQARSPLGELIPDSSV